MARLAFRLLFFIALSAVLLGGIHLYLYRRLVRDVTTNPELRRWGALAMFVLAMWVIVSRPLAFALPSARTQAVVFFGAVWSGVALALSGILGTIDVVGFLNQRIRRVLAKPTSPERRLFLTRTLATGSVVAASGLSAFSVRQAITPAEVTEVALKLPRLPETLEGMTLVQFSDIHIGALLQEGFVQHLVERSNALRPDAVVITGDLVDGTVSQLGRFVAPLQNLKNRWGTFFVTGNHDYYSGADDWCAALEGLGLHVLRNRHVVLGDAGGAVDMVGVDDWGARKRGRGYDLNAALRGRTEDHAAILLSHQPANFDEASERGIGLQLSGHTHGGQVFPATVIAGWAWPHVRGLYRVGENHIYVSRGTGFVGPPMRLGSPPEIVRFTLQAG
ncbi:MAG: metallophosphoesterase [Myxococcaceae bacterium]